MSVADWEEDEISIMYTNSKEMKNLNLEVFEFDLKRSKHQLISNKSP